MLVEGFILLVTLLLISVVHKYVTRPSNLPPGPTPLPIIGNIFCITGSDMLTALNKLKQNHGDIFTLEVFGKRLVVPSSGEIARDALGTDSIAGRPLSFPFEYFTDGRKDVVIADFSPALIWRRKTMHTGLRMYMKNLESHVKEEVTKIEERMKTGDPMESRSEFTLLIVNIVCAILCGQSFDKNHPEFVKILELLKIFAKFPASGVNPRIFSMVDKFPGKRHHQLKKMKSLRDDVLWKIFQEHKETFEEENIRDLTDAFLKAKLEVEREDRKAVGDLTDDHLKQFMSDVFVAGVDTTSTTLRWTFAYLIKYPHVQARAQAEIDDVIGDRWPSISDRRNLPYLEAVLTEALRISGVVPLGVHKANWDTKIHGYTIPEETTVIYNIWAIQHDPRDWERPNEFDPSRFMSETGKFETPAGKSYLPFGYGRRSCIGESMAKAEIFLILTRLLQQFTFVSPAGSPPPDLKGEAGLTHFPEAYPFCARERKIRCY